MQQDEKGRKTKQITSKKQKFVGYKDLIDPETGEHYPMQLNVIEERDFNFHKVWLQHLITSLEGISNKKLQLAFWIIEHLDKENKLTMTQRAIEKETGMSIQTVNKTMKALQETEPPFLVKINSGAYQVNPDVIFKGSHSNRMGVVYEYIKVQNQVQEQVKPTRIAVGANGAEDMIDFDPDQITTDEYETNPNYARHLESKDEELNAKSDLFDDEDEDEDLI